MEDLCIEIFLNSNFSDNTYIYIYECIIPYVKMLSEIAIRQY
jgi:hypothetical protein